MVIISVTGNKYGGQTVLFKMSNTLLVLTSCPDNKTAQEMASTLVDEGLAACVQIQSSVTSVYRWKGETVTENECLLGIKTSNKAYASLQKRIQRLHPYDLPEIIAIDIVNGLPEYLRWIEETTCKN